MSAAAGFVAVGGPAHAVRYYNRPQQAEYSLIV